MWKVIYVVTLILLIQTFRAQSQRRSKLPDYKLRKCCSIGSYYNLQRQRCVPTINTKSFQNLVKDRLMKVDVPSFSLTTGRLTKCRETEECFETIRIPDRSSHTLLPDGFLFEHGYGATLKRKDYCLETVGDDPFNVTLALAFCLPEEKYLPKCCPDDQYFDANALDCFPYAHLTDALRKTVINTELKLRFRNELHCALDFPRQLNLPTQAYLNRCQDICINSPNQCYSKRKFCVDNVFTSKFQLSAFVCADNATKICCRDEFYDEKNIDCKCHGTKNAF